MSDAVDDTLYIAVIGDLVKSRQLPDRAGVQRKLQATLDAINDELSEQVASRFLITLGDEFQGLLHIDASISDLWWFYQERMRELAETRFGFGVGTLSTELEREALGMDGPCFHAAREAIEQGHRSRAKLAFVRHDHPKTNQILSKLSGLLDKATQHWTAVQWETALLLHRKQTQAEVAEDRGVTKQSVQAALASSLAVEYQDAWQAIELLLTEPLDCAS